MYKIIIFIIFIILLLFPEKAFTRSFFSDFWRRGKEERHYIIISEPQIKEIKVAVPPIRDKGDGSGKILTDVLIHDLKFSGHFSIIDADPGTESTESTQAESTESTQAESTESTQAESTESNQTESTESTQAESTESNQTESTESDQDLPIWFSKWKDIGAEALILGNYSIDGEGIAVEFRLIDILLGKELVWRRYSGPTSDLRRMVHRFSDEVVLRFTGDDGIIFTRIAFVGGRPGTGAKEIYVMDLDGEGIRNVTDNGSINLSPSWLPDGNGLFYTSYKEKNPNLYLHQIDDGTVTKFSTFPGLNCGADISRDGMKIVLTLSKDGNPEIYMMNLASKKLTRLTTHWAIDSSPTWSPDGKSLAFISDRSGNPNVYVMDINNRVPRRLTFATTHNDYPAWSPQGDLIAFTGLDLKGFFQVYVTSPDGLMYKRITTESANHEFPTWSPDGRKILYTSDSDGRDKLSLCVAGLRGEKPIRIPAQVPILGWPAWSPRIKY